MYRKILCALFVSACLGVMPACSGNGNGGYNGGLGGGGGTGNTGTPNLVAVTAGSTATANIVVDSPAVTGTNKLDLEFISVDSPNTAYDTAAVIHQGASNSVLLLAGPGITSSTQVSLIGPSDITLGTPTFLSGSTPALQVSITVSSSAALGARTIVLKNSNNDISTFAGGLEVVQ